MEIVSPDRDRFSLFFRQLDLGRVVGGVEFASDRQATGGGRVRDEVDDHPVGGEGPAAPVEADPEEHPVFDLVTLRSARRQVRLSRFSVIGSYGR